MFKLLLVTVFVVTCSLFSFASGPAADERGNVWIEFSFPWVSEGPYKNPIDQQQLNTLGHFGALGLGWEPFAKKQTQNFLVNIFKNVGVAVDGTFLKGPVFPNFVSEFTYYQEYSTRNQAVNPCYYLGQTFTDGSMCNQCSYSPYEVCYVVPMKGTVYSRDTYIKYSSGSVAIGAYVPVTIAEKLAISTGVNWRFHSILEGIQTDSLTKTTERSVDGVLKIGYVRGSMTFGYAMEKSFSGMKYSSKAATVSIRF